MGEAGNNNERIDLEGEPRKFTVSSFMSLFSWVNQ